jgi:hypothetical protein
MFNNFKNLQLYLIGFVVYLKQYATGLVFTRLLKSSRISSSLVSINLT